MRKELFDRWANGFKVWGKCDAVARIAAARLCRVDDPDEIQSLKQILIEASEEGVLGQIEMKRAIVDDEATKPERIITQVASADEITGMVIAKLAEITGPSTPAPEPAGPPAPPLTREEEERMIAEMNERRVKRSIKALPPEKLVETLVATGLFVLEADGRLKLQ